MKYNFSLTLFDRRDPEKVYVFVRVDPVKGEEHSAEKLGWHGKDYPAAFSDARVSQLLYGNNKHNPLYWPKMAPRALQEKE